MSTKTFRNKNKNKKTLKQRITLGSLSSITKQDKLACALRENPTLLSFTVNVFYDVLLKNKNCKNEIVNPSIIQEKIDSSGVITQIGFTLSEATEILNTFKEKKRIDFINLEVLKKKIHATTTCLSILNSSVYQSIYVRNDPELFNHFIKKLRQIFNLPLSFTEKDFLKLYDEANPDTRKNFDSLIVKILHTSNNVLGVIQMNYGRETFARVNRPKDFTKTKEPVPDCFNDITTNSDEIYGVANTLDTRNTFTESIFKFYDRKLTGGISGSSYYLFFLITKILKYKENRKSVLSKVLCISVMDYVPLWHSLEEVLTTYSVELKKYGFPEYTIDKEPVKFFKEDILSYANKNSRISLTSNFSDKVNERISGIRKTI